MSYSVATAIVFRFGLTGFLTILQLRFPALGLYSVSTPWLHDAKFICKAKGARGDLIVSWFDMATLERGYISRIESFSRLPEAEELAEVAHILQPFEFLGWFEKHSLKQFEKSSPTEVAR